MSIRLCRSNVASFIVQLCYCWWRFHIDQLDLLHRYSTFFFDIKDSSGQGAWHGEEDMIIRIRLQIGRGVVSLRGGYSGDALDDHVTVAGGA